MRAAAVDTVVHNDIVQFPEPGRPRAPLHDVNVIGTLQLLTVCERPADACAPSSCAARRPSTAPSRRAPAFFTEEDADRFPLRTRFQRDIGELERLVGAFARRHPAVDVHRAAPAAGRRARPRHAGQPPRCARPVVPTVLGFDPRVQLLDADDASAPCAARCCTRCAAPVNVAADGVVSLSRALRHARRPALPIAAPLWGPLVGAARRAARPAGAARRDRALPALRARRRHHAHAPRAGLPARALDARGARARSGGAS